MRKQTKSKCSTNVSKSAGKSCVGRTFDDLLREEIEKQQHEVFGTPCEEDNEDDAAPADCADQTVAEDNDETEDTQSGAGEFTKEDFDRLLDRFIASEMACVEDEEEEDGADDIDDVYDDADDVEASAETERNSACGETDVDVDADGPLLKSMDFLVGLDNVKARLTEYEKMVRFDRWRRQQGLPSMPVSLHSMFLGSPGTGKTTVAKMMGVMLRRAGVLSKGHVVVRERATLMGTCYGDQEAKTIEAINQAEGGILFIDEAYQLYQPDDPRDPGKFVIESLLTALADKSRNDWMLILAGYSDEMRRMFDMNPGLASRIPDSNIYVFEDLDEGQLMQVAERYLSEYDYTLSPDAHDMLIRRIASDYAARTRSFGNARYVHNLIQTAILPAMATRVVDNGLYDKEALTTILPADIPAPQPVIPRGRRPMGFVA